MILNCPECQARFAVPDSLIPPDGRTVKCGRCAHQWHCEGLPRAEGATFAEMAAAAAGDAAPVMPRQLPVVAVQPIRPLPFMIAAIIMLLLWPLLELTAHYRTWIDAPIARGLYGLAGIHTTQDLAFDAVTLQRNQMKDGQTQFLIAGSLSNHGAVERTVPTVRVELKNKTGDTMWTREYPVNEKLAPGATYPFRIDNVTTSFAGNVVSIVLDVGHGLQLTMR